MANIILNFILARFIQDLVYPIVNEMDRVVVTGAEDYVAADHKVVGMLGASFYWRSLIRNILPKGSTGIQVVFHNPCSKSFTYQINGPNVEYLGVGDHHDPSYDSLGKSSRLDALEQFAIRGSAYSGAPIHSDFCPFSLHLYPSDVMKDAYTSYNSITFALAAVFIFAFTSVVFYLYDAKVESRQAKVMSTATRTSAIVSSLFPSGVRDRLYTDAVTGETGQNGDATKKKLQRFIKQGEVSTPTIFTRKRQSYLQISLASRHGAQCVVRLKCSICWNLSTVHLTKLQRKGESSKWKRLAIRMSQL
jgi:hypothetical protein